MPNADVRMRGFSQRISVTAFETMVRERCGPLPAETVPLAQAAGRVLAENVISAVDVPAFDRSAMDGYALHSEETFGAGPYNPLSFRVVGQITPGRNFGRAIAPGEAVRIMTGAPLPPGADAVLMAEYASEQDGIMTATEAVSPHKHVGRVGEDIRQGQAVLPKGRALRPQDLGVLASIGQGWVSVLCRPAVTLLITGDELLKPGERPEGARIVDSNSIMLAALIERDGGTVSGIQHLPDRREAIADALRHAPGDLLVTTGGTSVGVEDHAPTLLAELGELLVHGVAMRPSAPSGFGLVGGRPVFLLPGNPVSCLAAYDFFVRLGLRHMAGRDEAWPYRPVTRSLRSRIVSQIGRVDYVRVRLEGEAADLLATSGASILSSTSLAEGFVVVPEGSEGLAAGDVATVWLYD